ncbi:hypothetical protein ZOSMA_594G00020 [Zostera marina]|uniref:Fungal lipase-type domain-containing protein n=1 Tax=Zostera marina TaxID=29655 RepID=A0A0K9NV72_ZOSMR|nr:hypothetical protein ZOSMA_594G00020 [Zostera marina]
MKISTVKLVKDLILELGENFEKIWLGGHSLGAAIATYTGLYLTENNGRVLETFLFNPPFNIFNEFTENHPIPDVVIAGIRQLKDMILTPLMKKEEDDSRNDLKNIHLWIPNIFVNPNDNICKGFIAYFKNQEHFKLMKKGNTNRFTLPWNVDSHSTNLLSRDV